MDTDTPRYAFVLNAHAFRMSIPEMAGRVVPARPINTPRTDNKMPPSGCETDRGNDGEGNHASPNIQPMTGNRNPG